MSYWIAFWVFLWVTLSTTLPIPPGQVDPQLSSADLRLAALYATVAAALTVPAAAYWVRIVHEVQRDQEARVQRLASTLPGSVIHV